MSTASTPQRTVLPAGTLPHGRFVWYDLMTTDVAGAIRFYGEITGWEAQAWGEPGEYTMFMNGEAPIGGVTPLSDDLKARGIPPHWMPSVCVRNVDEALERCRSLGGSIVLPVEVIPEVGRYAIIADPQGVPIAIFTPAAEPPGHAGPARRGEFSWHELATTDRDAAFAFYSALFEWEKTGDFDMGPDGLYQMYGQDGQPYGGIFEPAPGMPMAPSWLCYVRVDDLHAAIERVKSLGGQLLIGPTEVPGGDVVAACLDPQGAAFALQAGKR